MEQTKTKLNTGLFVILLLVFFPAAIGYAVSVSYKNSRVGKPPLNGFISKLIYPGASLVNAIILLPMAEEFFLYLITPIIMFAAMLVLTFLDKGKNTKLFNALYLAAAAIAFADIAFFGLWLYMLGAIITLPFGIVGAVRGLKYNSALLSYEASKAEATEATDNETIEESESTEAAPAEDAAE